MNDFAILLMIPFADSDCLCSLVVSALRVPNRLSLHAVMWIELHPFPLHVLL